MRDWEIYLGAWLAAQLPLALVVGRVLHRSESDDPRQVPAWAGAENPAPREPVRS